MSVWRVAAGLVILFGFLTSLAAGGEVTYSGIPGKWKKGAKLSKDKGSEPEAAAQGEEKEKGKRTMIVPKPAATYTPASDKTKAK